MAGPPSQGKLPLRLTFIHRWGFLGTGGRGGGGFFPAEGIAGADALRNSQKTSMSER